MTVRKAALRDPDVHGVHRRCGGVQRRRLARLAAAGLAACLFVTGLLLAAPAGAGEATSAASVPAATREGRVTITVTSLDPAVATPGIPVSVSGSLRNTGRSRLTGGEVRLRLSRSRLNSRAELAAVAAGRTSSANGEIVSRQKLGATLPVGGEVPFLLPVEIDDADTRLFGVYVLTIEVVGGARDGFGRAGVVRSFLPWLPNTREFRPAGFAWLWPLVAEPAQRADEAFADDDLASELAPTGRLDRLVTTGRALAARLPITWAVDPALLDDAQAMSDGYTVALPDGGQIEGGGAALATDWLDNLRGAVSGQSVLSLPFGDPDVVSLRRRGLLGDVQAARTRGEAITATVLRLLPRSDISWPADGFADRTTVNALRAQGFTSIVLDARAVAPELALHYTPSGRADIRTSNGTTSALLIDPTLSRVLGSATKGSPALTAQRFLAETAMITAELPSLGADRTVLVAPPRSWAPSAEFLNLLADVVPEAPWLAPVTTDALAATRPPEIDRRRLRYPASIRKRELSAPYLAAIRTMKGSINVFSSVLAEHPNPLILRLQGSIHRLESSWWRNRDERVNRLVEERRQLTALRREVRVLPGNYTFGSRSGVIPVTISNGLDQEVVVDVDLVPRTLLIEMGDVPQQRIAPDSKIQVPVQAQTRARGVVLVDASLRTPEGSPYDHPVELRVNVTRYGTVALYVTLGAAAVLVLASIARLTGRALRHRRSGHPEPVPPQSVPPEPAPPQSVTSE